MRRALIGPTLLLLGLASTARGSVDVRTWYDDDRDLYITKGSLKVDVPFRQLCEVAGALDRYRVWSLIGINGDRSNRRAFITILRDVRYHRGGAKGLGLFEIWYDVDLVWPVGKKNQSIRFDIVQRTPNFNGKGIDQLGVKLTAESFFLDRFDLQLVAVGGEGWTIVSFMSRVKFAPLIDTFFSMARYKRNIEWRIVKVIENLKAYVEKQKQ